MIDLGIIIHRGDNKDRKKSSLLDFSLFYVTLISGLFFLRQKIARLYNEHNTVFYRS